MSTPHGVTVLGGGSWGSALALLLHAAGQAPTLWSRSADKIATIRKDGVNKLFLGDTPFPPDMEMTANLEAAVSGAEAIVFSVPSWATPDLLAETAQITGGDADVILTSKGFASEEGTLLSDAAGQHFAEDRITYLAGPSHAEEVARRVPTTVVASGHCREAAVRTQELFSTDRFRVYTNHDLIGVEVGTALKNIIALAAGMGDGLGFGDNTKGALLTRGLAEITRLGLAMGAEAATFAGLAGMGDLITTCVSPHSRNRRFGEEIAKGKTVDQVREEMVMIAEGVGTTRVAARLGTVHKVEMPITRQVEHVLFHGKDPMRAMEDLMKRDLKAEVW